MSLIDQIVEPPNIFKRYETEETALAIGSAGKQAIAFLTFDRFGEKTYLTDVYNELPAKVLRALYYDQDNPGIPYIMFSNPTGGIVQGDRYIYRFTLNEGSEAFITDTTATKVYRMDLNYASRNTDIYLYEGSRLEYLPKETIVFKDSRWFQRTTIHLKGAASFLYSEIFMPGRVAMGEFWNFDVFSSRFIVERDGKILLFDSSDYYGRDKELSNILFAGNKYLLTAYWFSKRASKDELRFDGVTGGASSMPYGDGLVIRALSDDLDKLKDVQLDIWKNFRLKEINRGVPFLRMY
ncbi:MAG: urease accessory protein UreD [Nitrososphaerota archaeon]|jgi:urease accessory protein|nr:urease accessory protein UreD [Nitrososphaerota archaeon]MDG7039479.1 urease accessory protein UreD [Nitrososphaerota archaeon]MDG7040906.1 urease accessory protein UreD [Nitrososphaerota archaeon]MDG7046651.1 urease accessory protein UreD [Nitrososphaerota archaeon]